MSERMSFDLGLDEECPICMEGLTNTTTVCLGCCRKKVHLKCYVTPCPFCRANLAAPPGPIRIQLQAITDRPRLYTAVATIAIFITSGLCFLAVIKTTKTTT